MRLTGLTVAAVGALALSAGGAAADIVCNDDGDCWHVRRRIEYRPEYRLRVYPDDWRWRETDHYRWREHEGRGYWRSGVWIDVP
jgi:hypothetical protein